VVFDLTPNNQAKSGKYFNDASSTSLQLKNKKGGEINGKQKDF